MFNSRNPKYRNPTGAVTENTKVHFKITVPRNLSCSAAFLIIEEDGNGRQIFDMFWCGMNGEDKEWWECHFTPENKNLYFYNFEMKTNRGHVSLYKGIGGEAVMGSGGNRWQMTVYSKDLRVPQWLSGGIMYQIFPDRFYSSSVNKSHIPDGRTIHEDWKDTPQWQPNEKGVITNQDYFCGDLKGITQKLDYLKELGVSCIYLNPIFEAHSNHRYNTADYSTIDPLLGTEEDFSDLCAEAEFRGISIILDGVFSHTGSDSVYFNREGRYDTLGAYNSQSSPYSPWYTFKKWPEEYESWWNFDTLPNVSENNFEYNKYINGENGIIQKWLKLGASGWRLDVADELPDEFLDNLNKAAKSYDTSSIVLGEVWEDASNKFAYGFRRRYLLGGQLDTVMNYPFRDAILGFLCGDHSSICMEKIESITENYPAPCVNILMNHIGTHDTERAITILAGEPVGFNDRRWQSEHKLSPEQREIGISKLMLASLLQFTLPGVPCIYYGDEAGMEGYKDPFNRGTYPWDNPNNELILWYKNLSQIRKHFDVFIDGKIQNLYSHGNIMSFIRYKDLTNTLSQSIVIVVNRSDENSLVPITLNNPKLIAGTNYSDEYKLPPFGYSIFEIIENRNDINSKF